MRDPLVRFQRRHYIPLVVLIWGAVPTAIPVLFWNESPLYAFMICVAYRFVFALHCTWTVNSLAHLWGTIRPYNRTIKPNENSIVSHVTFGEGMVYRGPIGGACEKDSRSLNLY